MCDVASRSMQKIPFSCSNIINLHILETVRKFYAYSYNTTVLIFIINFCVFRLYKINNKTYSN
jgi:hypothetical protein